MPAFGGVQIFTVFGFAACDHRSALSVAPTATEAGSLAKGCLLGPGRGTVPLGSHFCPSPPSIRVSHPRLPKLILALRRAPAPAPRGLRAAFS